MDNLKSVMKNKVSRRKFIAGVSAGMGATAAVTFASGCDQHHYSAPATPTTTTYSDNDILNFALNLEYVESEYFLRAATGAGLSAADSGANPGTVTGGTKVDFTVTPTGGTIPGSALQTVANELALVELEHLRFLRKTLGSAAVDRPAIDFTGGFTMAATQAGIITATNTSFSPFSDPYSFLLGAFVFADVGVTALNGAAPLIKDKTTNLPIAAGLLGVESYQAGEFRSLLTYLGGNYVTYANEISALRANAGGGKESQLPILSSTANGASSNSGQIVPSDSNSLAYARTTDQVLHILYLSASAGVVSQGGFFPKGLNGNIKATVS